MRTTKSRRYQVITYSSQWGGEDEKLEYSTVKQALKAIRQFWPNYEGWGIWDHIEKRYVQFKGYFPVAYS